MEEDVLIGADLVDANLSPDAANNDTDLIYAYLLGANLTDANLTDANLSYANLEGANLNFATLTGVTWEMTTCPDGSSSNSDGGTCSGSHLTP
jgi:uncharacterized protein YjbI with pentapeptide repeats